jgi:hypothetical protein
MKGGRDEEAVEKTAPEEPDLLGNIGNLRLHRLQCRS